MLVQSLTGSVEGVAKPLEVRRTRAVRAAVDEPARACDRVADNMLRSCEDAEDEDRRRM
jgi:hypothetical protein